MRLCCNCFEGLLDEEMTCPICNSNITLNNEEVKKFYRLVSELYGANEQERQRLEQDSKYRLALAYVKHEENHPKHDCSRPAILDLVRDKNIEVCPSYFKDKQFDSQSNQVHCPKCNSTSITTGARGINFTWGLIGASKTVNRCANCGYTWKPKL